MPDLILSGCSPVPLAHYLKALGVLRIVGQQADTQATAAWHHDALVLHTRCNETDLIRFLVNEYRPTPILSPWNAGSGFYFQEEKSKQKDPVTGKKLKTGQRTQATAATRVVDAISTSINPRLSAYRDSIFIARSVVTGIGIQEAPEAEAKSELISQLRSRLPDEAMQWIDCAAVLMTPSGADARKSALKAAFPPILGTGGNDGNTDFSSNFMQRISEVLRLDSVSDADKEMPETSESWLRVALFGGSVPGSKTQAAIGQFQPGTAGGPNLTSGFDCESFVNPWDFILMIEGAILFTSSAVRRLESSQQSSLVSPFCVWQSSIGYASAAGEDETNGRGELWTPLWESQTSLSELAAIFSEARVSVGTRAAQNGVDFARAVVASGVDRGLSAFQRFGFCQRNGKNYFATPLERVIVRRNARADLLADIEHWHSRLRQKAGPTQDAPASVARALNLLERRIVELCREDSTASSQAVIAALGNAERALAKSFKWTTESAYLRPLHGLKPQWLTDAEDGSTEFRLAASLAGMRAWLGGKETLYFRQHLEPLEMGANKERSWASWDKTPSNDVVWHEGDLTSALNAILARRLIRVERSGTHGWPDFSPCVAKLADITDFIEGRTNDALLSDLIWGFSLLDWEEVIRIRRREKAARTSVTESSPSDENSNSDDAEADGSQRSEVPSANDDQSAIPSSFYALLRLCFRRTNEGEKQKTIPLDARILHRAMTGDGTAASELAARRLRASGMSPLVNRLPVRGDIARRTAAAMLFPISAYDMSKKGPLQKYILKKQNPQNT